VDGLLHFQKRELLVEKWSRRQIARGWRGPPMPFETLPCLKTIFSDGGVLLARGRTSDFSAFQLAGIAVAELQAVGIHPAGSGKTWIAALGTRERTVGDAVGAVVLAIGMCRLGAGGQECSDSGEDEPCEDGRPTKAT
jgi:hypothetical protein